MRYAVISDIHSNLEAFQAVIECLAREKIDKYLCLGDVIGYGADPHACLRLLQSLKPDVLIAGNHEWAVLDLIDIEDFSELAKEAVVWTKSVLTEAEIEYLKSFRLIYESEKFILVHGTLDEPGKFYYILSDYDAYNTMKLMKAPVCFAGHSHVSGIFYSDNGSIKYTRTSKVRIDYTRKYVINPGSVGQPRDSDPNAACAIYDDRASTIEIKRIPYDISTAQKKILEEGLPRMFASRLAEGR